MKNRLKMVSKVRNFWLCVFSGVVATTLIRLDCIEALRYHVGQNLVKSDELSEY